MRLPPSPRTSTALVIPILFLSAFGLAGCGLVAKAGKDLGNALPLPGKNRNAGPEIGTESALVPMGEVSFVDVTSRFVLVRTGRTINLKTGAALEARRGLERVAELSYSPETRRGFLVADILRGHPAIGDLVMIHSAEIVDQAAAREKAAAREEAQKRAVREASKERGRKRLKRK